MTGTPHSPFPGGGAVPSPLGTPGWNLVHVSGYIFQPSHPTASHPLKAMTALSPNLPAALRHRSPGLRGRRELEHGSAKGHQHPALNSRSSVFRSTRDENDATCKERVTVATSGRSWARAGGGQRQGRG
ncbi:hypothetical protein AAFF_G00397680 [Aldrovandia affinis]|uniref:Uncharacterized protein n=1 Tax=Aldrovandia affinis TaxID=143900 RepID=A0AAD7SD74_9TELE|nr:hypothetical protein AAFF_G00397680 [Aldrovandia affinis]